MSGPILLDQGFKQLLFKLGLLANINTTATQNSGVEGEPHWVSDAELLYMHNGTKNVRVGKRRSVSKTADYTLTEPDDICLVDTTSGAVTITLMPAADVEGQEYTIKKVAGGNTLTIDGDGSEEIDGSTTKTVTAATTIHSDGTEWWIVSQY